MLACREVKHQMGETIQTVYYFYAENAVSGGQWKRLEECSSNQRRLNRFLFNRETAKIIRTFAKKGWLDGFLTETEVKMAQQTGKLPSDYNLHHFVPIEFGGTNDISNICVMDKRLHQVLHQYQLDLIRTNWMNKSSTPAYLYVPNKHHVITLGKAEVFFTPAEAGQLRYAIRTKIRMEAERVLQHREQKYLFHNQTRQYK